VDFEGVVYLMKWFFGRIFGGKRERYKAKNPKKPHNYFFDIWHNIRKNLIKNGILFSTSKRKGEPHRGVVLAEFGACMPIIIILLFYICDLIKIRRMYSQMEFVGQQMVNILQNIAKERTIKYEDLCHAASLAYLSVYPGKTMYSTVNASINHELIHCPFFMIYYVKGTTGGNAKVLWARHITTLRSTAPDWHLYSDGDYINDVRHSSVGSTSSEIKDSNIYPTLKMESGKPKIILETAIFWNKDFMDGNGKTVSNARQAFGLRLVNPKHFSDLYFNTVVIFSPNDGFSETPPS